MRVIVAGSRDIFDYELVKTAIEESQFTLSAVVSGGCKGVDALGERYADEMNIPLHLYLPDWSNEGKAAGPIRNRRMAENADALVAIWDGKSRGTKNMIETAEKHKLFTYIKMI